MKSSRWILVWIILIGFAHTGAHAQSARPSEHLSTEKTHGDAYDQFAKSLRLAPKERFNFSEARVGDILSMLAAEAGIVFESKLDHTSANGLVTLTLEGSPFSVLEAIAKAHNIELFLKPGVLSAFHSPSGKVKTATYEHPFHNGTTPAARKQWPSHVSTLFRPHDRSHRPNDMLPTLPIVEIECSIIQVAIGHEEILLGPQDDGPITKIVRTDDEKSLLEALLANPNTRTINQRQLSLRDYQKVLLDHLSSEIVDGFKLHAPGLAVPGQGNIFDHGLHSFSVVLPIGTQVALECQATDEESTLLHLSVTQAGLRQGPNENPTVDMLFAATLHHTTIKAPIGKTVVIGSFEEHASPIDIALNKAQTTRTLLMVRPTKVTLMK